MLSSELQLALSTSQLQHSTAPYLSFRLPLSHRSSNPPTQSPVPADLPTHLFPTHFLPPYSSAPCSLGLWLSLSQLQTPLPRQPWNTPKAGGRGKLPALQTSDLSWSLVLTSERGL